MRENLHLSSCEKKTCTPLHAYFKRGVRLIASCQFLHSQIDNLTRHKELQVFLEPMDNHYAIRMIFQGIQDHISY